MLVSLISGKQMAEQIKEALADAGDVVFEHNGKLDSESVKEAFFLLLGSLQMYLL
ncbi:hypothetical protein [Caldisericum sp. AR60]|uniref:hypothetical protein n=1 Tax=Caldisericum sp. AR60 TaxID=3397852 RepID=UPI0039FBE6AA